MFQSVEFLVVAVVWCPAWAYSGYKRKDTFNTYFQGGVGLFFLYQLILLLTAS